MIEVAKCESPKQGSRHLRLWLATSVALLVLVPTGVEASPRPVTTSTLTFVQVSAGSSHTCALSPGGDAHCWGGFNNDGESPPGVSGPFTAISAGYQPHLRCQIRQEHRLLG